MLGKNSTRRLRHTMTCKTCGKEFQSNRSDAQFHDQACKKYWRRNGHGYAHGKLIKESIEEASRYNPNVPPIPGLMESLEDLKDVEKDPPRIEKSTLGAAGIPFVPKIQRAGNRGMEPLAKKSNSKKPKGTKKPKKGQVKKNGKSRNRS